MSGQIVLTVTGPDRVGIVEEVTQVLLDLGGNVETSRMMRLGGEFAMMMLVALPAEGEAELGASLGHLVDGGYKVTASPTEDPREAHARWRPYRIEVHGADHEGIIHQIAAGLAHRGISIESAETATSAGAVSAVPLFSMTAVVVVPPGLDEAAWRAELADAAHEANVDVAVAEAG